MSLKALVFDAYGTLFDVHSVVARCETLWPDKGAALSRLWRSKQLEYTWLRSLSGRYENFEHVTANALRYATAALGLPCDETTVAGLMDEYRRLGAYPGAIPVLDSLAGRQRAILSNGSPEMLQAAVANAGLDSRLEAVLSVDSLRIYKPHPSVYQLAVDALKAPAESIGFVTANGWDAAGAKAFGFTVFWINRNGAPVEQLGAAPDHVLGSLSELPALV